MNCNTTHYRANSSSVPGDPTLAEGKAYRYVPIVDQETAGQSALARVLHKLFDGSPELLLTQLVAGESLDATKVRRLRKLLDDQLATRRPRGNG